MGVYYAKMPTMIRLRRHRILLSHFLIALTAFWQVSQPARAAVVFWDINGTSAGASGSFLAAGTWDASNLFFNTDLTGGALGTLSSWNAGDVLAFAAGSNARGSYNVTVSGIQSIGGLIFEEGQLTLNGGTLQMASNSEFNVANALNATVQSVVDGSFSITKTGAGRLNLEGANTYTGNTIINAGILAISADASLGMAPIAVVSDSLTFGGGTLQITGTGNPVINSNRGITINSGITGILQVAAASNSVTYGGVITGAAGTTLAKTGSGTLDLQGNSPSMLGALNVTGGTLRLSGSGSLAGVSGTTLGNRAALTLDNTTTSLGDRLSGGAFNSNGGTLNFIHGGSAATNYSETIGALTLNAGALTINTSQAASGQTSVLTIPSLTRNSGGTAFFSGTGLGTDGRNSVVLSSAPALVNSVLAYAVVNNGALTSFANYATGGGTNQALRPLALASHAQAAQGATWTNTANVRPAADQTLSATRAAYTLTLDSGIDLLASTADRTLNVGNGGLGGVLQTGGVSTVSASGNNEYVLAFGTNEALFHIIGELIVQRGGSTAPTGGNISGTGGLTKTGPGQLTVTNSGMTGAFRLNEGTYRSTAAAGLGAAAATLEFNGGNLALAASTAFTTTNAGGIAVNADALITIDRAAAGAGVTHVLPGALTIGDQVLTVAKGAFINADSNYGLTFSNAATGVTLTGSPTLVIDNNGTGIGTINLTAVNSSSGLHTLIKQGSGNLIMSGTGGFQNPLNVQAGLVGWSNNTAATFITESNLISGAGGVVKSGASGVMLTAVNTYSGPTTITAGALQAQDGAGLPDASNLILNGGVFQTNGTFIRSLGAGSGQVQWTAGSSGGFAANGGSLAVTLAGAPNPLTWDAPFFISGAGALLLGSVSADDVVTFTHNIDLNHTGSPVTRTFSAVDNTSATTDWAVLSGVLSNSSGDGSITKTGNGVLQLSGSNTFTGGITVSAGTLQFSTISNNGGGFSNLGQGTDGISLGGGTLAFVGGVSQVTNRAIALTASSSLDASGTGGAVMTYNGAINGAGTSLTLTGSGSGVLNSVITQTGTTADLIKSGAGTWQINAAQPGLADDIFVNSGTLILNAADAHDGDDLFVRAGTLVLGVNGALTSTMDDLNVSTETSGGGILDIHGTAGSAPTDIIMGSEVLSGSIIDSIGGGSIGSTTSMVLRNGLVSANLTGAMSLTKNASTTVTLSGNNSGFTGVTTMVHGALTLDYSSNNGEKLSDVALLNSSGGGTITLQGSAVSSTIETLGGLSLNSGALTINLNNGSGQTAVLNLGGITRASGSTVAFHLSSPSASIQTSSTNGAGTILGGYATVGGSQFATVLGGTIQAFNSTAADSLASWTAFGDITDSAGYAGTVGDLTINSLRFNASGAASSVSVSSGSRLTISTGGILVTPSVGTGVASVSGGTLVAAGNELIVHQNNLGAAFGIGSRIAGSTSLTKSGTGALLLSGSNVYAGPTMINEGTLQVSGGAAIGDNSLVQLKGGSNVVFDLNGGSETIAGLTTLGATATDGFADGNVAIGSGSLTLLNIGATRIYQGSISGSGTLVKSGPNSQAFFGPNSGFAGTVVINQGLLDLSEGSTVLNTAAGFSLNGGELLSDQETSASVDHIGNSASISLSNTAGTRGLWVRNVDQDAGRSETVGGITLDAGHNVIQADSNDGSASESQVITLTSASLLRNNRATLLVRGQNLGGTANSRGQIVFTAGPSTVGGTGAAGSTTMPIITFMIAEAAAVADTNLSDNLGNSFVFNTGTTNGLRPLSTVVGAGEEYVHNEAGYNALSGSTQNNVRFVANPAATLTGTVTQINSLVLDASSGALSVTGPASSLNVRSGAILAATTVAANAITLGGFTGLTAEAGNDFIIYVTNATNTFTLNSPLLSATPLVKAGAGTLVLTSAASTITDTFFNQGFVQVDSLDKLGTGNLNFFGGGLRWASGSSFDASTRAINLGAGGGIFDTNGNDVIFGSVIGGGGTGELGKAGLGTLTLNAAVNSSGGASVSGGTLKYGLAAALPVATNLTLSGGTLDTGSFVTTLGGLTVVANSSIVSAADVVFTANSFFSGAGARILTVNSTGTTTLSGATLTLVNSGTTARNQAFAGNGAIIINSEIQDGGAAGGLTYSGTNTLTLNARNSYSGPTSIDSGTVLMTVDQNLAGALRFGSANTVSTAGILDLSSVNASFAGGLTVQNNSTTANQLIIGPSRTLSIGGNVAIGSTATALTTTLLNATGGGSLIVNNQASGSSFVVGASTSGTAGSNVTADFSGLSSLTIQLNTTNGIMRVNPVSSTNVSDRVSTLILPGTGAAATTVTAATLAVGDSGQNNDTAAPFDQTNQLKLGSGVNTLNVNTVNIGTGSRDAGSITFNGASGSLILNDTTGAGPAAFNMGTGTSATGAGAANTFDVSGHHAVLNLGGVNIGTQAARVGAMTNVFSFDQGTLSMASLNLSSRNTAGGTTSTFNIAGGTVTSGPVTMATTGAAAGVAVANLNITGGASVTMSGSILKGGGTGINTANFLLSGASTVLDMGGFTLGGGGAGALDGVVIESGTLKNLAEFNGGAAMLVKSSSGTLKMDGTNTYTGGTDIQDGLLIAVGGASNRLGSGGLSLGAGILSGILQLGDAAGTTSQTVSALGSVGTGTANAIVGGNASFSTLTVNQSGNTTFDGALGGAGANQNNLHLIKSGSGELVIGRAATMAGNVSVTGGKLFLDGFVGPSSTLASLSLADGTEFSLRGTSSSTHSIYNFSGSGDVMTVGSSTGATLGFALDGGFNTRLNLGSGQSLKINGTLTTAVYVNNAPNAGQPYVLINAADDNALFGTGAFNFNPVVFNGGSFTYALTQVTAGSGEQWVLTPSAQAAAADVWWRGDLTGIATGVWSASLTSGAGSPTNWDESSGGGVDALVPPDSGSIVHFSATGAGNFATTLGANLTIQELLFHSGGTAISIGSSGGTNTLTLGNTVDGSGLTMLTGAPNVSISANVALAQAQAWNLTDSTSVLNMSGALSGVGPLALNSNGSSSGTLILSGVSGVATYSGGTTMGGGRLILEGGADNRLPAGASLVLGSPAQGAVLQLGDATNGASNLSLGSLSSGTAATNSIVGGGATLSLLTITQGSNGTYNGGIGGAGLNENNLTLVKAGAGTLLLNGVISHVGTTTVNEGVLRLGSSGSITQSSALAVNANAGATAALDVNGRTVTLGGGITLAGADSLATPQILDTAGGGTISILGNILYDATNNPLGGMIASGLNLGAASRTITANDSTAAVVDLSISGSITNEAASTANGAGLILDGAGTGLLSGNVFLGNGTTNGENADLTKNGTGTWTLTGSVTVGDNAVFNAGTFNINTGGSLVFNGIAGSTTPDFVLDAGAPVVNLNTANAIIGNSATNLIYLRDGSTLNINADGAISNMEEIRLGDDNQGTGNLVVNNNISVGILTVGFNSSGEIGNVTGSGTISGLNSINLDNGMVSANLSGVGNIDKDSLTVTLSGNNALTGTTLVREGTLNLDFAANNAASSKIGTGNLTMGSTTNNDTTAVLSLLGNSSAASLQTVANLTAAGGPSQINLTSNGGQDVTLRITGVISRSAGTLNLSAPDASTKFEYTGSTVNTNGIVGGWMTLNDRDFVTIAGGQLQAATYSVQNDASLWGVNANITNSGTGFAGTVSANCNTINSLRFDAADASTVSIGASNSLVLSSGAVMLTSNVGSNASLISGGSLVSGSGTFFFHQNNSAGTLTVASNLLGSAALTKNGAGTLVLTGSNATGTVNIDEGILRISGGNAISDTSTVNIRSVAGTGLEILAGAGNSETIGSLAGDGSLGQVIIGSGATLTINQSSAGTFAGVISGAGNLVKEGAGTLTVSGDASLSGLLTLNAGRITISGSSGAINDVSGYVLNGAELLNVQDQSSAENRIRDTGTAAITLNNTAGTGGLWLQRTAADSTATENVGNISLGFGHNVITVEPGTGTGTGASTLADLVSDVLVRGSNRGTLLVRGTNLGSAATGARRGFIRFDAAGQAAVDGFEVGDASNTLTKIKIIPWMVGETSATGLGNSFVTNVNGTTGLRPLATSEYINNDPSITGALTDNIRFTASTAITATPSAINSLVIDSGTAVAVTGSASSMEVTTGAILAAGAGSHSIGTISGITTGGGRDYNIFVTAANGTLTMNSPLLSAVPLVKSGAGTLRLMDAASAITDIYLNQGLVSADDLDKLGTGSLRFHGGGLRLEAGWTDDLSTKLMNVGTGGGTLDVGLVTAGVTLVNGLDATMTGAGGPLNIFTRNSSSGSTGQLTIQGSSSYTGTVIFRNSGISSGQVNGVVLNGDTNAAINGNIEIGNVTNIDNTFDVVVALGASEQIVNTASITFRGASGENAYFKLMGFTETVAGISGTTNEGVIENVENSEAGVSTNGRLIVDSSDDYSYTGYIRNRGTGTNPTLLEFEKRGTGTQTLVGSRVTYTGDTTITGGTLRLTDTTAFASNIINNSSLLLNSSGTWTLGTTISGTGALTKTGVGSVTLGGANSYSGPTLVEQGMVSISASSGLGDGGATNTIRLANGAVLQSTGASVDLGVNRSITLAGTGGVLEVTGSNSLTVPGALIGDACHVLTKSGTGLLVLTNTTNATSFAGGSTAVSAGILQVGLAGVGSTGSGPTTVAGGAVLAGTGSVAGSLSVASGGVLHTGDVTLAGDAVTTTSGIGTLNVAGNAILAVGSTAYFTLDSPASSDLLNVGGNLTLAGNLWVTGSFVPAIGQTFNLIDWAGLADFSSFNVGLNGRTGADDNGFQFDLPDIATSGFLWDVSNFMTAGTVTVIPEPSRALLFLVGLMGLLLRRRRGV